MKCMVLALGLLLITLLPVEADFLDALRDNTAVMDGTQLFARVREQVRLNADQTPQYSNIRLAGHEVGGDYVFVLNKR